MQGSVSEPVLDFPSSLIPDNPVKPSEPQNILLTALKNISNNTLKGLTRHVKQKIFRLCLFYYWDL